jgi:hypothetical protein
MMTKIDERMLECARALKGYCKGFDGDCTRCLFNTDNDECVLISFIPKDWDLDALSKTKAVEVLKEMRENISRLDGNEAANRVTALTMAIEALED